jgi:uncharacterized RDD family membrane protein YckC
MSDIPVGSPPVPPGRHAAPGGWYADPVDPARERYWDGWQWSRNTRPREGQPPPYAAAAGAPAGYPTAPGPALGGYPGQTPGGYGPPGYPAAPAYGYPTSPVAVTADGVPLAGWWWRVLAVVIDNIILSTVVTILAIPLRMPVYEAFAAYWEAIVDAQRAGLPLPMLDPNQLFPIRAQMLLTALTVGIGLIYHVTFLRWKGATLGKLACRLRVVPVDRGLSRPGLPWNASLIRAGIWVLPGISSLLALFTLVDVLFPLWQPKRQALHDLAAKTQVIRAP